MPHAALARASPAPPIKSSKPAYARRLLIGWLIIVALITVGTAIFYQSQAVDLRQQAEADMTTIAKLKVNQIESWLADLYADAGTLAANPDFLAQVSAWLAIGGEHDRAAVVRYLNHATIYHPERELAMVDRTGTVLAGGQGDPWPLSDFACEAVSRAFAADELTLIDLHRDNADTDPHLAVAIPLRLTATSPGDRPLALLMRVNASKFLYPLIAAWPIESDSHETLLVRRDGDDALFLNSLRFDPDAALRLRVEIDGGLQPAALALQGIEGVVEGPDYLGTQVLAVIAPVASTPWFLIAKISAAEVFAPWRFRSTAIIVVAMFAAISGGVITYSAWQNAVNEEYQRKLEAEMRLRESESRFEQLVEAAPDPIFITSGGEFAYINPAATRLFGASDASLLMGQPTDQLVPSDAEEQEDAATHSEQTYWRLDNTEVPVDVSSVAIEFHGRPSKLIFAQDITERRQAREEIIALNQSLTERVRQRTLALESANRELEAFVYSASHDLRAPLRALDGFAGILAEEYHAKLDQEGQRLVRIIRASAEDMDRLIGDLLRLSRTSRAEMRHERIDMTVLVQRAWEATASTEVRSAFSLELAALPAASGDPVLIRQVWLNLLDNAVKYTVPKSVRCIWIGSWQEPGEIVYYVRDSGVGFDPRHVGKLFGVFQRLHSTSEFAGNGIGLALVQRIVSRHGGRVWAEGQPDQGATFYFTLPEGVERTDDTARGQTGGNNASRGQSA